MTNVRRKNSTRPDKMYRIIVENVLYTRTPMILHRLTGNISQKTLFACVSQGEKSSAYYAMVVALPGSSPDANGLLPHTPELLLPHGSPKVAVTLKAFKTSSFQFKYPEQNVAREI